MSKYVCDTEEVKRIGSELIKSAEDMTTSAKEYASKIESDLSEWDSSAKSSFSAVNQAQVATTGIDAEYASKLGEFIQVAAEGITTLDEELASNIKI